MINSLGGRKFLITIGCGVVTTILVWFGKIDGTTYTAVILGTVGVYLAANAYQSRVENAKLPD
jgi:hypothetical protein